MCRPVLSKVMGLFGACLKPENKQNGLDITTLAKICKPFLYRRDCPGFNSIPLKRTDSLESSKGTDNELDKSISSKTSGSTINNNSITSNNNNNSSVFTTPTRMKLNREKGDFSGNLFSPSYNGTSPRSKEISFTGKQILINAHNK